MTEFKLTKDEIVREIMQIAREQYPDISLKADLIHKMTFESSPGKQFMFPAGDYAALNNLDEKEFVDKLHDGLGIEFEKNLHDKFLFEMSREENMIYFNTIQNGENE
jgi:hypothetical protein